MDRLERHCGFPMGPHEVHLWMRRVRQECLLPAQCTLDHRVHEWTHKISSALLELERKVFLSGYQKAFLLVMDSCCLCKHCVSERSDCKNPRQARPTPEGLGVDVFQTVQKIGYPIEVLSDYEKRMNRYAFLMVLSSPKITNPFWI